MRILKIILFTTVLFLGFNICFAQEISIRGGFNLSQYSQKAKDFDLYKEGTKLNPGFNFGSIIELPITNIFSLETGILFTSKGYKYYEVFNEVIFRRRENLYYLDIPVLCKVTVPVKKVGMFAMAGPYIGEALFGIHKEETTENSVTDKREETILWGDKHYEYDRFDYGLIFGAGLRYVKWQVGASYKLGLKNIRNSGPLEIRNRIIELYISYSIFNFNSNKK